jgi:VIT1/CCC1 family predicted Fe2+/Mn2+ transporter
MYLVRTITNRGKRLTLAIKVRSAPDAAAGVAALRESLPSLVSALTDDAELEKIRQRLVAAPALPDGPRLDGRDFRGAFGIFLIVVASTFPVALPFVVMDSVSNALFVSRVLTLVMLFAGGYALGRFAGYGGWKTGIAMAAGGVVLTMAIIALGG